MNWRTVAVEFPFAVQEYIQKHGPLPDGEVTEEDWNDFREGRPVRYVPPTEEER